MPGEPDPLYVLARRALLDGLAAPEFTIDADLAIAPEFLADTPNIGELLEAEGFELQEDPGKWKTADGIQVDLLVPDALAGPGRRGARLFGHGRRVARRAKGIEGVLVDSDVRDIGSLDPADRRSFRVAVPARPPCSWPRSTRSPSASAIRIGSSRRTPSTCSGSSEPYPRTGSTLGCVDCSTPRSHAK